MPHGHWKTTTLVAGLRRTGMIAPMMLDGPINRDAFVAYVREVLVPKLSRGDIVIMDSLSSQKPVPSLSRGHPPRAEPSRRRARACSSSRSTAPHLNPIEKAFSRLKAIFRKAGERTISGLSSLIGKLVDPFQPQRCANYFGSCRSDPD